MSKKKSAPNTDPLVTTIIPAPSKCSGLGPASTSASRRPFPIGRRSRIRHTASRLVRSKIHRQAEANEFLLTQA